MPQSTAQRPDQSGVADRRRAPSAASSRSSSSRAPALESGSLRLPHFGRLHARGAAARARALRRSARCASRAQLLEARERGARDADAAGVPVVDEDRRSARSAGGGWSTGRRCPSGRTSRSAAAPRSARARSRAARRAAPPAGPSSASCRRVELEPQRLRGEARRRQVERDEVDLRVVGQAPALVGEHRLGDAAPRRRTSVTPSASRRSSRRSISVSVSRLGCVYQSPSNGRDERAAALEVELAHLVGAAEVQVDRALVHGRVRARGLGRAEQLARGDVDDREAARARPSAATPPPPGRRRAGAARRSSRRCPPPSASRRAERRAGARR